MLILSAAVSGPFQVDIRSGCSIYVGQLYVPRRILVGPAVLRKTERELFIRFPARKSVISTQTCRIILSAAVSGPFQVDIRSGCSIYVGQLYVPRRILVGPAVLRKTERELFI